MTHEITLGRASHHPNGSSMPGTCTCGWACTAFLPADEVKRLGIAGTGLALQGQLREGHPQEAKP